MTTDPEFSHFVLTRFNVRYDERASEEWLRHRLDYFERLCWKSMSSQTNNDFQWLVYFDAERDDWFQNEVDRLAPGVFQPVWVDGPLAPERYASDVAERTRAEWIITTRVDNDDAVARDFIASIQGEFARQDLEFVNFQSGLQLSADGGLFHRADPSNAFISLIERNHSGGQILGVYVDWHDRVSAHGPIRQVPTHPMWLQMVHGLNIGNAIRGVRADPALLARHFDVDADAKYLSQTALRLSQFKTTVALAVRVASKPSRVIWLLKVIRNRLVGIGK